MRDFKKNNCGCSELGNVLRSNEVRWELTLGASTAHQLLRMNETKPQVSLLPALAELRVSGALSTGTPGPLQVGEPVSHLGSL